jgi:uncharacterized membrane protein YgdD (TMEM256/DUF423 family)
VLLCELEAPGAPIHVSPFRRHGAGWVLGAALFSGDLALRAFTGHRLFVMAAPAGGIILIAAWLALAAAALAALWRG